jgi:hypothetical protein
MRRRSTLRASDADRDRIAEWLRNAAAEGRLVADELERRLETTFSARTYGELDAVVADLPRDPAIPGARGAAPVRLRPATALAVLVLLPFAVAIAVAAVAAIVVLVLASALVVTLMGLVLGPRARVLGMTWAVSGRRARRLRRGRPGLAPWL